jgi:putative transposase
MARLARLCIAEQLHLVIQRSRRDEPVLATSADNDAYLACLREAAIAANVAIHAFALTPTQVRILATPPNDSALSAMLQFAGRRFVAPYNRRHGRHGPLWDGRFHATVVDADQHYIECVRFVETAPVQMHLAEHAEQWPWSSAAHHSGRKVAPGLTEHRQLWALGNTPFEREVAYKRLLDLPLGEARSKEIESAALHGWAIGPARFIESLALRVNRPLRPSQRGRPPAKPRGADVEVPI